MDYPAVIEARAERWAEQMQEWLDANVMSHLVELLNKAQRRIKHPIRFVTGNGTYLFVVDGAKMDFSHWLTEAAAYSPDRSENPMVSRLRDKFPELVEFVNIIAAIGDNLGQEFIGDVFPTTKARKI